MAGVAEFLQQAYPMARGTDALQATTGVRRNTAAEVL
jgi:hypothetical protein